MGLFDRIGTAWKSLRRKPTPPGYVASWGGGSSWTDAFRFRRAPSPPELVESYKSLIYACVNLNASAVARTPLRLYAITRKGQSRPKCAVDGVSRKNKDRLKSLAYTAKTIAGAEEVEEVTDHPLLHAVMRVNEDLDHAQLITYTVMSLDIVGSAYWWPAMGSLGIPEELWALPPHLVYPTFDAGSMVPSSYTFGGVQYPKDDLVRFRRLSAKNPYGAGYGPEQAAIEYARLEDTFVSIQDNLLSNGPRPSLIVSHKDPKGVFGPSERKRLEDDMERRGRGGRAGGVFVVDGAAAITPISYSPTDLGALQVSSYDLERIANCFDVPVSMLKTEDVNRANAEAGLEQHSRNAVEPRCKLIASTLTRWTHSLDRNGTRGWDRLFWAFDPVVVEDKQAEAELHKTYLDLGVITRNEVRTELGYSPAQGGDVLLVAGSLKDLAHLTDEGSNAAKALHADPATASAEAFYSPEPYWWSSEDHLADFPFHRTKARGKQRGPKRNAKPGQAKPGQGKPSAKPGKKPDCGTGAGGFKPGNDCGKRRSRRPAPTGPIKRTNQTTVGTPDTRLADYVVGQHGRMPRPRGSRDSHHGLMSVWMRNHYPHYKENLAPAVLMQRTDHKKTIETYNNWRKDMTKEHGGNFSWLKVTESQARKLSKSMFDAAGVPKEIQKNYWDQFRRMRRKLRQPPREKRFPTNYKDARMFKDAKVLTLAEMKKTYGAFYRRRPERIPKLDPNNVPEGLRPLIPYAAFWGISDDFYREGLFEEAPREIQKNMRAVFVAHENEIMDWLGGTQADGGDPTDEYVAFSFFLMLADFAQFLDREKDE